jgi:hypothetical protein
MKYTGGAGGEMKMTSPPMAILRAQALLHRDLRTGRASTAIPAPHHHLARHKPCYRLRSHRPANANRTGFV